MDNINITVNETIENIVVNPAITTEVIDVNITGTTETVNIDVTPNLTTVNINSISGSTITNTSQLINDGEDGVHPFITLEDIPAVTGFVPYVGATEDVNLGEFGVQLGNIEFDLTPTNTPTAVGSMFWNDTAGTLDLKLKGGAVTLQIGQETVARVVNKTATNITLLESNYQIVRVTGAQGQRPKVDLALANNDLNSTTTLGLVTENILNNQEGFITTSGQVQQINTTGSLQGETWVDGDVLYLSGTVAGRCTNIKPIAPIHTVIVGFVEYAHINQGKIFVKVDNGYELEELHNVSAIAPNNNEVLTYDTPTLLWKPKTISTILGYTPFQLPSLTSGSVLFSNGTTIAQKNSNFFWDNTNNRLGIGTITPNASLHISGSTTASAAIARGSNFTPTLVASANSDVLVGLDITPTFTNAAFTNVNNISTRIYGGVNSIGSVLSLYKFSQNTASTSIDGAYYLGLGQNEYALNSFRLIGFGYHLYPRTHYPAYIGYQEISTSSSTFGDLIFGTRNVTTDTQPSERMRINSSGNILIGTTTDNGGKLQIKAPGALSTDIALRVRNSADTANLLDVDGIGNMGIPTGSKFSFNGVTGNNGFVSAGGSFLQLQNRGLYSLTSFNGGNEANMQIQIGYNLTYAQQPTNLASAILDVTSTTKGFLPPRMTSTQKNAIATPASGLVVYDTTLGKLCVRGAASWETITSI